MWGKILKTTTLFLLVNLLVDADRAMLISLLFRLKRQLEQAQPSTAKRLKVGASSKTLGK